MIRYSGRQDDDDGWEQKRRCAGGNTIVRDAIKQEGGMGGLGQPIWLCLPCDAEVARTRAEADRRRRLDLRRLGQEAFAGGPTVMYKKKKKRRSHHP